jgi:pimeloyl-ACP methyl ester carboxylesterase
VRIVREFDTGGPRSDGPPVVWAGPELGPALVVVDPMGTAKHDDVPATWRELAGSHQIAWCRLPASRDSVEDIEDVLETLADRRARVDMVAGGEACEAAVALAGQFEDVVRSVLLVDPPAGTTGAANSRVVARTVARTTGGDRDRVEAPLPLGHPDAVAGVVRTLADAEKDTADGVP